MKAHLLPLKGKYYGTEVALHDNGAPAGTVVIWLTPNTEEGWKASERELASWEESMKSNLTPEEYAALPQEEREYEYCDNHYETTLALQVANILVEAVNNA